MARLYLSCGLCGRKQADGLLSRAAWGHLELNGAAVCACPTCQEAHRDWQDRLRVLVGAATEARTDGAGYRNA